jgi:hypothetical protein
MDIVFKEIKTDKIQFINAQSNISEQLIRKVINRFENKYQDVVIKNTKEELTVRGKKFTGNLIASANKGNIHIIKQHLSKNKFRISMELRLPASYNSSNGYSDVVNQGRNIGKPISIDGHKRIGRWARFRGISDNTKWKDKSGKSREKPNRGKRGGPTEEETVAFLLGRSIIRKGIKSSDVGYPNTIYTEINRKTRNYIIKDLRKLGGLRGK